MTTPPQELIERDRDEWRTQHENLLGIYREQAKCFSVELNCCVER
jgi:hypothetical protein